MGAGSPRETTGLAHALGALRMAGALLHIGVHPDDEESGMIALLARGHRVRTVYWSATRGEGGQNRRGPEKREKLGIVRTWESLAAREIDGAEVLYGPFYDFGFSKTADDSLARWGRDEVIREIVRAIRLVQPQVVVGRWSGTPRDGHGQHQAIGVATREAVEQAADTALHADLGLPPWDVAKLYCSVGGDWQPGESGDPGAAVPEYDERGLLRLDAGRVDSISGLTFQELANTAFNEHRSQGMAFLPEPGPFFYYYERLRSRVPAPDRETSFYDGLDPELTGLADYPGAEAPGLREALAAAIRHADMAADAFHPDRPGDAGLAVLDGRSAMRDALASLDAGGLAEHVRAALARYLTRKIGAFEDAAARCMQVRVQCLLDRSTVTSGRTVRVATRVWNGGPHEMAVDGLELTAPEGWIVEALGSVAHEGRSGGPALAAEHDVTVTDRYSSPAPYWLRESRRNPHRYEWPKKGPLGFAVDDPLISATVDGEVAGHRLRLTAPALHRRAFAGGWSALPLTVLPPVSLSLGSTREMLPLAPGDVTLDMVVVLRCLDAEGETGALGLAMPRGWGVDPVEVDFSLARGDSQTVRFTVQIPAGTEPGVHRLRYLVLARGELYGVELEPVRLGLGSGPVDEADCLAQAFLARDAAVDVHLVDAEFATALRYAYVPGLEEEILESLAGFGLDFTVLEPEELAFRDLSGFDAIVVGPNAYAGPAVRSAAAQLLGYVEAGGALIVQYQTYGYDSPGLAPYGFSYHEPHDRVTQPDVPVETLRPNHPVLATPNTIRLEDWNGWVHDRGLYFMGEWDPRYTPIVGSNDPGEDLKQGGLLVASYGRGTYAYAAYSFSRQIPAGVPGAIRLFANLLALGQSRIRERVELLRGLEVLDVLSEEDLEEAALTLSERRIESGGWLCREGDAGDEAFVVAEGELEIVRHTTGGEKVTGVAGPGTSLNELAALAQVPSPQSLRARAETRVLVLSGTVVRDWLRREPELATRLVRRLAAAMARMGGS